MQKMSRKRSMCCFPVVQTKKDMLKQLQIAMESLERCGQEATLAYYQKLGEIPKGIFMRLTLQYAVNVLNTVNLRMLVF